MTDILELARRDEAIVRAARAAWAFESSTAWDNLEADDRANLVNVQRAAVSAFLADVPVSEAVRQSGIDCLLEHTDDEIDVVEMFKAMCAKLSEELIND